MTVRDNTNSRKQIRRRGRLSAGLLDKCISYAKAHHHPELTEQTIWEVFEAETIYDPWHYVPVLARKPGALRNGAPTPLRYHRNWKR